MNFSQLLKMPENGSDYTEIKTKSTPIAMVAPEMKQPDASSEITRTCAVLGCEESKNFDQESFFRFPEEPSLRQIWTDLTGRNSWTPTDYSYICIQHFPVDSFVCNDDNEVVLTEKAVPTLKLPRHVLEIEYIDETLDSGSDSQSGYEDEEMEHREMNGNARPDNLELLSLFTDVQRMQREAVALKEKVRCKTRIHNQQNRYIARLKEKIVLKEKLLSQKAKKKARILLSLQDKMKDDKTGLVLAMPTRYTDDLKNFALNIYKYSPQSYIYARNTLRTLLPSTDVLENWLNAGYHPKNILTNTSSVKIVAEQSTSELSCKVTLH